MSIFTLEPELDQQARIKLLRGHLAQLNSEMAANLPQDMPADLEEEYLRHILEYEEVDPPSIFDQLTSKTGADLPHPDTLEDAGLTIILMKTAQDLADLGVYLLHTDHRSDREIYFYLYFDGLREEAVLFAEKPAWIIDMTGSGSDEDNQTYLRYFADEPRRQQWAHDWPNDTIPAHEPAPFDRDRFLPKVPRRG
jgi:hypothetical protein